MKYLMFITLFFIFNLFANPSLVIITMADLHGQVEPVYELNDNKIEERGGFSRISTIIQSIKRKYPDSIVTMQGDYLLEDFQNGKYFSRYKGKAIFPLMNNLQIDIATLGNHEFDYGINPLLEALQYRFFPLVLTNMSFMSNNPKDCFEHFIIQKNGYKIGFMGLMTPSLLKYQKIGIDIDQVQIDPNFIESAKKTISNLKNEKVDFIVVLSHLGLENDKKLGREVSEIDIILGGHSHNITNKEIIIDHPNNKTLIVHTGDFGKHIGLLKIFKKDGKKKYFWKLIKIDKKIKKNPSMEEMINKLKNQLTLNSKVKTKCTSILDSRKHIVRSQEATIGNLITDIFKNTFKTDIALISGDSIRGNKIIIPGNITDNDIDALFLFKDFYLVKVKGKYLKKTLELSISETPQKSYNFWQVSGIKFRFDPSKQQMLLKQNNKRQFEESQKGKRIQQIEIKQKDGSFEELDDEKEYSIIFNSSLIPIERDFFLKKYCSQIEKTEISHKEIIINYLKNKDFIAPRIEGRIVSSF